MAEDLSFVKQPPAIINPVGIMDDDVEISLESDIDLFSQPPSMRTGATASSPFAPAPASALSPAAGRAAVAGTLPPPAMASSSSSSSAASATYSLPSSSSPPPPSGLPPSDGDLPLETPEQQEAEPVDYSKYRLWEIGYYQRWFNVTTVDVLSRMAKSIIPYGDDFFTTISGRPDFYGAFWVPTTLIFFMAATGNFGTYLACQDPTLYVASFLKVVWGAFAIYGYVLVLPLVLWGVFKWLEIPLGFAENLCLYGYSLTIYLPLAVLCIIPSDLTRWVLLTTGGVMVCVCLFRSYWSVAQLNRAASIGIAVTLSLCNLGLVIFFRLYLFQYHADSCRGNPSHGNTTRFVTPASSASLSTYPSY